MATISSEQALEKGAVAAVVRKDQAGAISGEDAGCWRWTTRLSLCRLWRPRCAACGQSRWWRNWFGREDNDQRSDRPCAFVSFSRAEVGRAISTIILDFR